MDQTLLHDNEHVNITVERSGGKIFAVFNDKKYEISNYHQNNHEISFEVKGKPYRFFAARNNEAVYIYCNGTHYVFEEERQQEFSPLNQKSGNSGGDFVASPMPGTIIKIQCAEGEAINEYDPLVIVEAMKMENILRSPVSGNVAKINNQEGDLVEAGKPIVEISPEIN
jgi:biotin carboxyl carrier protein